MSFHHCRNSVSRFDPQIYESDLTNQIRVRFNYTILTTCLYYRFVCVRPHCQIWVTFTSLFKCFALSTCSLSPKSYGVDTVLLNRVKQSIPLFTEQSCLEYIFTSKKEKLTHIHLVICVKFWIRIEWPLLINTIGVFYW